MTATYTYGLDTPQVLTVAAVPQGVTVEVVTGHAHNLIRTGRVYNVGPVCNHLTGQRYAYERFTNHRTTLHPSVKVITAFEYQDAEGRWL